MVAQAVVEEIALPVHAVFSGDELLPVPDGRCDSRLARERDDRVQMIGHKQAQPAMPDESLVIEFDRSEHGVANAGATQLVFARWHAVDGDEEPTAFGHPLWNCVRQLCTHGQTHASSVPRRSHASKREKVGRITPLRAALRQSQTACRGLPALPTGVFG